MKLKEEWKYKKLNEFEEFKEEANLQEKIREKWSKWKRKMLYLK